MSFKRSKNCTIVNPKPTSVIAIRIQAIIVISSAKRVLSQAKWLLTDSLSRDLSVAQDA
jgi:hypothetical protein